MYFIYYKIWVHDNSTRGHLGLAKNANCPTGTATQNDRSGILKCLRKMSAYELNNKQVLFFDKIFLTALIFWLGRRCKKRSSNF